jgi:acyl dehydratase
MKQALYYDDFEVGQVFVTPARTITETDVVLFAGLSGDYNVLHTDAEAAGQTIFGQRIAHGLLGLAVTSGLKQRLGVFEGTIIAFLGLTWEFCGPILFGDTIHARITIDDMRKTSKPDRGIVTQKIELINQHEEIVQSGTHKVMIRRRQSG